MSSSRLKLRLQEELPKINACLAAAIGELPSPCQPIASHIINSGGKRLRPFLCVLMARLAGNYDASIYRVAATMEMLHAATLLHDDLLDQAKLRRGRTAAHIIYGDAASILAGDALLALGNSIIAECNRPILSQIYSIATMETAAGEILEMEFLRNPELSQEQYLAIARGKTACLIGQSCAMGACFGANDEEFASRAAQFGEKIGIAFQIVDDALDFSPESQTGKPEGGDLREGKLTIPLSLYRNTLDPASRKEFDRIFSSGDISSTEFARICAEIRPFASKSLEIADSYLASALELLQFFPAGEEVEVLREITSYIRDRSN